MLLSCRFGGGGINYGGGSGGGGGGCGCGGGISSGGGCLFLSTILSINNRALGTDEFLLRRHGASTHDPQHAANVHVRS